jgi:ketosteroid isomerase-like protein
VPALRRANLVGHDLDYQVGRARRRRRQRDTGRALSENLDLVRSIYADWERGDFSSVAWAHPEIEFVVPPGSPTPGTWIGAAAMAESWRDWLSAWEDWRVEADEYHELDDERVLVLIHQSGRGKSSGLEIGRTEGEQANLFHLRDGKVTKLVLLEYEDRERALADLGLKE